MKKSKKAMGSQLFVRVMCIFLCVLLAGGSIVSVLLYLTGGYFQ